MKHTIISGHDLAYAAAVLIVDRAVSAPAGSMAGVKNFSHNGCDGHNKCKSGNVCK